MAFVPSATAITMATTAGNNMFALDPKYTSLKDTIAGGSLAPAAFMDAIVAAQSPRCVAIYNTVAGQSIPNAAGTVVNFGTAELDTDSAVTIGATWRFTCPSAKAGVYHASGVIGFGGPFGATAAIVATVLVNGAPVFCSNRYQCSTTDSNPFVVFSGLLNLAVGQTVSATIFHNAGAARSLDTGGASVRIGIVRVA
jgi:hypothetical protein